MQSNPTFLDNKITKYGNKAQRLDFSKFKSKIEIPNLLDVQVASFNWLIKKGIDETFKSIFPIIKQATNTTKLEFLGYRFKKNKISIADARLKNATFSKPLYAKIRLFDGKTGEVKDDEVFFGDFPMMTSKGTFIINGAERVIVSQLVRSAGIHYYTKRKPTITEEEFIVIPTQGSWIEYLISKKLLGTYKGTKKDIELAKEFRNKDKYFVKLDRNKKLPVPTLLVGLGLSIDEQKQLFGHSPIFNNTLAIVPSTQKNGDDFVQVKTRALFEIYAKIKPGEPATIKGVASILKNKFFNPNLYRLGLAGRYKFNTKLWVGKRIKGTILAEDIVSSKGKVVVKKNQLLVGKVFDQAQKALQKGANIIEFEPNDQLTISEINLETKSKKIKSLDNKIKVQVVKVFPNRDSKSPSIVVGNWQKETRMNITISDIIASFSYLINLIEDNLVDFDDVDNLANRRIKGVGELVQNQFRIGLTRIKKNILESITSVDSEKMTPKNLINIKPLVSSIREFFLLSQLSQFMDQTNPQSELSNKRRISALGPGGLSRSFAGNDVRDVNFSHFGRICPIETPEGANVGLINNLALYARVNNLGFIETPYAVVKKINNKYFITDEIKYLSADEENESFIGTLSGNVKPNGEIIDKKVVARYEKENIVVDVDKLEYMVVSPQQILSIASSCIPFLEHDDATRAAMGANMQRQAIPLLKSESPIVGTGLEHMAAKYSGAAVVSKTNGKVSYVDSQRIEVNSQRKKMTYHLDNFVASNQGTIIHHNPIVTKGERVKVGDILADGAAMENGELALGANVLVAFSTLNGYNYEDAIVISERLVKDDVYSSIHILEYEVAIRNTPQGDEEITSDLPNVATKLKHYLGENGIIQVGAFVNQGDILVGKISPKAQMTTTPEEKLIRAIFGDKSKNIKETSLRVPYGVSGFVQSVNRLDKKNAKLPPGVNEIIKITIAQKRKIQEGDKMAGRHGNKGVISIVLPEEDMPVMPDGTIVDILLNPLGVPSRMNIGQVLEIHLGMAAHKLGIKVSTPGFDGCSINELLAIMQKANLNKSGKVILRDGKTGEPFAQPVAIGYMYILKLSHMVDDKMHSRATGPYSIITQQPLGGKAQKGGQRFGEMEVWALEAYGAAHTLQELLTIKSDDINGRSNTYDAILYNKDLPQPSIPESFIVLQKELQALALNLDVKLKEDKE